MSIQIQKFGEIGYIPANFEVIDVEGKIVCYVRQSYPGTSNIWRTDPQKLVMIVNEQF